jgi:hypothetical protein
MKKDNFIWWVLGGVGAVAFWYYYQNNKKKSVTTQDLVVDVLKEEQDKYSTPFQAEYKIVMPSDMVSAKVKAKSAALRAGRFAIQPEKVQAPLYI